MVGIVLSSPSFLERNRSPAGVKKMSREVPFTDVYRINGVLQSCLRSKPALSFLNGRGVSPNWRGNLQFQSKSPPQIERFRMRMLRVPAMYMSTLAQEITFAIMDRGA